MGKQARQGILEKANLGILIFFLVCPKFPQDSRIGTFTCPIEKCLVRPTRLFSVDHRAVDIESDIGDPVYASASGKVYRAGIDYDTGNSNRIIIIHDNGYVTLYWHLDRIAVSVRDYVHRGQLIGYSGKTGWSSWPHLHFGIIDPRGNYVDPLEFIDMETA